MWVYRKREKNLDFLKNGIVHILRHHQPKPRKLPLSVLKASPQDSQMAPDCGGVHPKETEEQTPPPRDPKPPLSCPNRPVP